MTECTFIDFWTVAFCTSLDKAEEEEVVDPGIETIQCLLMNVKARPSVGKK